MSHGRSTKRSASPVAGFESRVPSPGTFREGEVLHVATNRHTSPARKPDRIHPDRNDGGRVHLHRLSPGGGYRVPGQSEFVPSEHGKAAPSADGQQRPRN